MPHPIPNPDPLGQQVHVHFYVPEEPYPSDLDGTATKEQGRPIYKTQEYVRVSMPANPKSIIDCLAHEKRFRGRDSNISISYAEAFPQEYANFKAGMDEQTTGTPLAELPSLNAAKRAELKAIGIRNVESLAAMEGVTLKRFGMEGPALKNLATSYLARAKGMAGDAKQAAENAALRAEMETMREQLAELAKVKAAPSINPPPVSEFDGFDDNDLRIYIKDRTGKAPVGRVSHETLVRMAEELLTAENAEAA